MMMNDLLKGILGEGKITPPDVISDDLKSRFPCSRSIEWFLREKRYEALFYCEGVEYIACYSDDGNFMNFRENVSPSEMPELLKGTIGPDEEVMNVVKVVEGDGSVAYEIISRDKSFTRYLLSANGKGLVTERKKL